MNIDFHRHVRKRLVDSLEGMLVVVSAYGLQQRTNDNAHDFTQEANFWYLTGIDEPDWRLILDGSLAQSWLVMPDIDEIHRIFEGGMSADEAKLRSGVDNVISSDEAIPLLRKLAQKHTIVGTVGPPLHADHFNFSLNPSIAQQRSFLERQFKQVRDIRPDIAKLRAVKLPAEIDMIQQAVDRTIEAFTTVHERITTYSYEYEIEAEFSYRFRKAGASGHAYSPIVAAGQHACTLHYAKNASKIARRELVLMDVGAEYGHYAADITRTYAKAESTKRQRQVHAAVEQAHHQIIGLIEPMLSVESYQRSVDTIMAQAIESVGLGADEKALRRYFPHAISHGLGIDVHDSLGSPKYFVENMVMTVEPGIYIPEEGIGVRIEDDIHVTANGHTNLSAGLSTGL